MKVYSLLLVNTRNNEKENQHPKVSHFLHENIEFKVLAVSTDKQRIISKMQEYYFQQSECGGTDARMNTYYHKAVDEDDNETRATITLTSKDECENVWVTQLILEETDTEKGDTIDTDWLDDMVRQYYA